MPTYVVSAAAGRLDAQQKARIAAGITEAHSQATGAQGFFAQVIFVPIAEGDHFLGGRPLKSDQIHVNGQIRAGRNAEQKRRLLDAIVELVTRAAQAEPRAVWVYIADVPPWQMVEYGRVLPEPGEEANWLQAMPDEDRAHLVGIGQ
ncbi:tautomerase family protein [Burkholderia gladioli]|uniref:tautomerase family protein n=1 Tax=Burkholderia gladioli TaxID=28095 RepID=UPI001641DC44|nr:tautomerase family protein [Burkholderia gladioli]